MKNGFVEKGVLKATTVHQELRMLRRMLNVAVRKKFLTSNPCAGVEFPTREKDQLDLENRTVWIPATPKLRVIRPPVACAA